MALHISCSSLYFSQKWIWCLFFGEELLEWLKTSSEPLSHYHCYVKCLINTSCLLWITSQEVVILLKIAFHRYKKLCRLHRCHGQNTRVRLSLSWLDVYPVFGRSYFLSCLKKKKGEHPFSRIQCHNSYLERFKFHTCYEFFLHDLLYYYVHSN